MARVESPRLPEKGCACRGAALEGGLLGEFAADRVEIGEHPVGPVASQFVAGVRASGHGPTGGEPALAGRGDVEGRIADEQRGVGLRIEGGEYVRGELGLRFDPGCVGCTEDTSEVRREPEVLAEAPRRRGVFVGKHGAGHAACGELADEFARAVEQYDVVEHRAVPVGTVDCEGGLEFFRRHQLAHRVRETAADHPADLFACRRRVAELGQRVAVAPVDGREVVDERAIKIEKDGAETHVARSKGAWPPAANEN